MAARCAGTGKSGKPCSRQVATGSLFCHPMHDTTLTAEQRAAAAREFSATGQEARRKHIAERRERLVNGVDLKTAESALALLEQVTAEVVASNDASPAMRAHAVREAIKAMVALRNVGALEKRVAKIQAEFEKRFGSHLRAV